MRILDDINNRSYNRDDNERSIYKKVDLLNLSTKRINELVSYGFKQINLDNSFKYVYISKPVAFEADKLVGSARFEDRKTNNWIEYLDDIQKMYLFDRLSNIEEILINPLWDMYPEVILYKGEYYIGQDGKHRLTLAKCLGNKNVKVIIKEVK